MKEIFKTNETTESQEDAIDTNEIADFNTKGSLKARLYCKNRKAMENVFGEQNENPRDSFVSVLDKSVDK
jgi:hypothetical protein